MYLQDLFYSIKRKYAPWWDKFDTAFAVAIIGILLGGYATFVDSFSPAGLLSGLKQFIRQSGLLALLTAFTAIIALYRLRHRVDKTRPSVREDFDNYDGEELTEFGLRNFGPGPALYLQAVMEVVNDDVDNDDNKFDPAICFEVHDNPIHLQEGEFASLVKRDDTWFQQVAEEFEMQQSEESEGHDSFPIVNLYYTYVSHSGAREPTALTAERDDTYLLENDDLIDRDDPRQIELSRIVKAVNNQSPDC